MKLYYTSSAGQDQSQPDPHLSLGGYRSASLVPSGAFGAMFAEVSQLLLSKTPEAEYIGVILKNDTGGTVENLWLWFTHPEGCYSALRVAAVSLSADAAGVLAMERVFNRNTPPSYAEFYEADGIANAVSLGNIEDGGMLGLWFERRLIDGLAAETVEESNLYENDPSNSDLVIPVVLDKYDAITINFRWGSEYYGGPIGDELI